MAAYSSAANCKLRIVSLHRHKANRVDALLLKNGPMQGSGAPRQSVGGVVQPPVNYLLLGLLLFLIPLAFLMYWKREWVLKVLGPMVSRL